MSFLFVCIVGLAEPLLSSYFPLYVYSRFGLRVASRLSFGSNFLPVFWPLVGSLLLLFVALFCMLRACVSLVRRIWRLLSDRVTELVTQSESVDFVDFGLVGFERVVLCLIVWVFVVADVAKDLNVEIDPVNNKSS